jgi:Fic family protein
VDPDQFVAAQRAHVVRSESGYLAFVPPPLPPRVDLDLRLAGRLASASLALGELGGSGRSLPNPHLLSRALLRREAVLSSRIEGTQASLSDLVRFEVAGAADDQPTDVREVYNYLRAIDHVLAPDRRLPLSLSLLREAHAVLLRGVRGGYATPGEFRKTPNWIGSPGAMIDTATFVPPPPEQLWECLDSFEKYLHSRSDLPPLLDIAAIHYQFEAIHPFLDGNGRVGRLLVMLLLIEWQLLQAPLLDLSTYIEPRRDQYYEGLLRVSTHGDWDSWFWFFLDGVEHQARDARARATRLHDLREEMRGRVTTPRGSGLPALLVDSLFDVPMLTMTRAQKLLGVTHRAATLNIKKLIAAGVLEEIASRGRQRLFLARRIMSVIEAGPTSE